jgi:hypothetical protein
MTRAESLLSERTKRAMLSLSLPNSRVLTDLVVTASSEWPWKELHVTTTASASATHVGQLMETKQTPTHIPISITKAVSL